MGGSKLGVNNLANQTRAVRRPLQRGQMVVCSGCKKRIKGDFRIGKSRGNYYVIANVYRRRKWQRTEHWEIDCYLQAGQPHGEIIQ